VARSRDTTGAWLPKGSHSIISLRARARIRSGRLASVALPALLSSGPKQRGRSGAGVGDRRPSVTWPARGGRAPRPPRCPRRPARRPARGLGGGRWVGWVRGGRLSPRPSPFGAPFGRLLSSLGILGHPPLAATVFRGGGPARARRCPRPPRPSTAPAQPRSAASRPLPSLPGAQLIAICYDASLRFFSTNSPEQIKCFHPSPRRVVPISKRVVARRCAQEACPRPPDLVHGHRPDRSGLQRQRAGEGHQRVADRQRPRLHLAAHRQRPELLRARAGGGSARPGRAHSQGGR
jgi:hypothetical protein